MQMRRTCSRGRRPTIRSRSRHSVLTVRRNRSAYALASGARTGVWMTRIPSLRNTSSKAAVNLLAAIVDQKTHPFKDVGETEVARVLNHPDPCRVRRATGEVDTPVGNLDEEEHIEAM